MTVSTPSPLQVQRATEIASLTKTDALYPADDDRYLMQAVTCLLKGEDKRASSLLADAAYTLNPANTDAGWTERSKRIYELSGEIEDSL